MRTWLRIIALSDALRLSALLCTTTLIRLLLWLMATSPPLEEKVNLYLIVSLPFSPGALHHFFIYSASILADSEKEKSLKVYLISSFFVTNSAKNVSIQAAASRYLRKMYRNESASTLSMQLRSKLKIQCCVCPFHYDFKCSHEISIPSSVKSFALTFILHSRVSLCLAITLTIFPQTASNTSS